MKETANKLSKIRHYIFETDQPEHTFTDQYNGMHLRFFKKTFENINILYPCKNDITRFYIELTKTDCVITYEMVNNICVNGYIFLNY